MQPTIAGQPVSTGAYRRRLYHAHRMTDLTQPWAIGDVAIPSRIVLAPMAGVSVQAFRRQGRRFGAGLVCSEMVSAARAFARQRAHAWLPADRA